MSRIPRFADRRFVGTSDDMRFYDGDDPDQFAALCERIADDDLAQRKVIRTFGPDTIVRARNRGFRPVRVSRFDRIDRIVGEPVVSKDEEVVCGRISDD
jgi:hypothetical protein